MVGMCDGRLTASTHPVLHNIIPGKISQVKQSPNVFLSCAVLGLEFVFPPTGKQTMVLRQYRAVLQMDKTKKNTIVKTKPKIRDCSVCTSSVNRTKVILPGKSRETGTVGDEE